MDRERTARRPSLVTAVVAWVLALVAAAWLASWPCLYSGVTETVNVHGASAEMRSCDSLVAVNGTGVLVVLAVPVALASIVLFAIRCDWRALGWAAATVLALFALAAGFSVGLFFLPAAAASLIATSLISGSSSSGSEIG